MVEKCCYTCNSYGACEIDYECTRHYRNAKLSDAEKDITPMEAGLHSKADYWVESKSKRALLYRIRKIEEKLGL